MVFYLLSLIIAVEIVLKQPMYLASRQARQILRGRKANLGTGIHLEEEKG